MVGYLTYQFIVISIYILFITKQVYGQALSLQNQQCGLGCSSCLSSGNCQSCKTGFDYDPAQKLCKYQQCDQNLLAVQKQDQDGQPIYGCQAICEQNQIADYNQNTCNYLYQCSSEYSTQASFNNRISMIQQGVYKNKFIVLIYESSYNIFSISNGQFIQTVSYKPSEVKIILANQTLFSLDLQNSLVSIIDIEKGQQQVFFVAKKGKISQESQLTVIYQTMAMVTTIDQSQKILYVNIFSFTNKDYNSQVFEFQQASQSIRVMKENIIITLNSLQKINFFNVMMNDQNQISVSPFLNQDLTCQYITELQQINNFLQIDGNIFIFSVSSQKNLFYFNSQDKTCNQSENIKSLLQIRTSFNILLQQQLIFISYAQLIEVYTTNFSLICSQQIADQIVDFQIVKLDQDKQIQAYILNKNQNIQVFDLQTISSQLQFNLIDTILVKINNPIGIQIAALDNNYPLILAYNYDCQVIETKLVKTLFILQSFQADYPSNKSQITSLVQTTDEKYLVSSSEDGEIIAWQMLSRFGGSVAIKFGKIGEKCTSASIFLNRFVFSNCATQIIIYDLINPYVKKVLVKSLITASSNISSNNQFVIINKDKCLIKYDNQLNEIFKSCSENYSSITSLFLQENDILYVIAGRLISQLDTIQSQNPFSTINSYTHTYDINQVKYRTYSDNSSRLTFTDSSLTLNILKSDMTFDAQLKVPTVVMIFDYNYPTNTDREDYMILGYIYDPKEANKFQIFLVSKLYQSQNIVLKLPYMTKIVSVLHRQDLNGDEFYQVTPLLPLIYVSLLYPVTYNINTQQRFVGQYPIVYFQFSSVNIVTQSKYAINNFIGTNTGFVGYATLFKQMQQTVHVSSLDQPINKVYQNLRLERYFILSYNVFVYNIHSDIFEEEITFNDQTKFIKSFVVNYKLRIIVFFKDNEVILKNYSTQKQYGKTDPNTIFDVYVSDQASKVLIIGQGFQIYSLTLQNQQILLPNSVISQCIFSDERYICKQNPSNIIIIDPTSMSIKITFPVSNIPLTFNISYDITYQRIFAYEKILQVYDFNGIFKIQLNDSPYDLIEILSLDDRFLILNNGGGFIYARDSLQYIGKFYTPDGGVLKKTIYIPKQKFLVYFTDSIRYGQVNFYNLKTLNDAGSFTSANFASVSSIVNLYLDIQMRELVFLDSSGNMGNILYENNISEDNNYGMSYLFKDLKPVDMHLSFEINKILVANQQYVYKLNYSQMVQKFQRYFSKQVSQFAQVTLNGVNYYLIVDLSNIIYKYNNFQLVYALSFNDSVLDILIVDSSSQLIAVAFEQKIITFLPSLSTDKTTIELTQKNVINNYQYKQYFGDNTFFTNDRKIVEYDFVNNQELFSQQMATQQDLINSFVNISNENKLIIGFFSGQVFIYNRQTKQLKELTTPLLATDQVLRVIYTSNCIYAFQRNGDILYLYEDITKSPTKTLQSNYISGQSQSELSNAVFDSQFSRFYISFQDQQKLFVLDASSLNQIKLISHSSDEFNKVYIGNNIIILYTSYQLNIYTRDTLEFIQSIMKSSRESTIDKLYLISDTYLVLTFTDLIEVYILDNPTFSFKLIDSIFGQFPQILRVNINMSQSNLPILQVISFTTNQVFEKFYSINLIESGLKQCSSNFVSLRSLDTQQQFQTVYTSDSNTQYSLFFQIGDSIEVFNQIQASSIQLIINPISSNNNSGCSSVLNLYQNSFLSLKNDVMINCFSFIFNQKGIYTFNKESQKVVFQNVNIKNQKIDDVKIQLINLDSIILQNNSIDSIQSSPQDSATLFKEQKYMILIDNCNELNIYDLNINNINLQDQNTLFLIRNVKNVLIKNTQIQNSIFSKIFKFESVENIQIIGLNLENNTGYYLKCPTFKVSFLIEISGSKLIQIQNVNAINNKDINFISSSNIQVQEDKIITLQTDELQMNDFKIEKNAFSPEFLSVNGEHSTMFLLTNSFIIMNNIQYTDNQENISIYSSQEATFNSCVFMNNHATNGGAINANNIQQALMINDSKFQGNIAQGSGGSIFLYNVQKLQIDDKTIIQSNKALIGGGIRYIFDEEVSQSYISDNFLISPKAIISQNEGRIYGDNIVSYPTKIKLQFMTESNKMETQIIDPYQSSRNLEQISLDIAEYKSGGYLNVTLQFLDNFNKIVAISMDDYSKKIYPKSIIEDLQFLRYQIQSIQEFKESIYLSDEALVNIYQYDTSITGFLKKDLQISGIPSTSNKISLNFQTNKVDNVKTITLNIQFRNCHTGEIFKKVNKEIIQCYQCPNGFYSLTPVETESQNIKQTLQENPSVLENVVCKKCPDSALECQSNQIKIKNGYWRVNSTTDEILHCVNNEESCIPESQSNKQGCLEGYIGPLCDFCDAEGLLWQKRFTQSVRKYYCSQCSEFNLQIIYILCVLLAILLYIIVQVIMFMNGYIHYQMSYYIRITQMLPISVSSLKDSSGFYMKILINYLQLSSIILHIKVKIFPSVVVVGPSIFGNAMGNVTIDINCVYPLSFISEFGSGRVRQISQCVLPPVVLIFMVLIFLLLEKFKIQGVGKYHKYTLFSFLIMFFQPDSLNLYSKSLTCRQIGSLSVFTYDTLFNCNDAGYNRFLRYFTIPNLLFWILFPLFPLYLLYKRKKRLHWCAVKLKLGYYYTEFKSQYYYWEFVRIYVKVLIVLLFTFFQENMVVCVILINLVITFYIVAVIYLNPFQKIALKNLEIFGFMSVILLAVLQGLNDQIKNIVFELLYVFFNYIFILYTIYIILQEQVSSPHNMLGRILRFMLRKVVSPDSYNKYAVVRRTSMNSFIRWRKIKANLTILTQLKAINTIDLKKINAKEEKGQISMTLHQQSYHSLQEKLKQSSGNNLLVSQNLIVSDSIIQKSPDLNQVITNIRKRGGSLFQKEFTASKDQVGYSEELIPSINSQIQLLKYSTKQQIQQSSRLERQSIDQDIPSQRDQLAEQQSNQEKESDCSQNIDDGNQYQEMMFSSPRSKVLISTFKAQPERKSNIDNKE